MSEEVNVPEEGEQQEIQITPTEQQALDAGWVPKEKFHGEEHKWVDAGEFLRRGELFKKIDVQGRELKEMKRTIVELSKHHADVRVVEYKRALDTLRAQKKDALESGDADAVIAADDRMDLVRDELRRAQTESVAAPAASGEEHPDFVEWKSKNSWYENDEDLNVWADGIGQRLAAQGMSPNQVLQHISKEVRTKFPNKFQNPRQERPGALEGSTTKTTSSSSAFQLTSEERSVMNRFVRQGVMTEEAYIKELKRVKGV